MYDGGKLWGVMPFRCEFEREHRILLVLFEGDIRDAEALTIKGVIASYLERLHPAAGIADLSAVKAFEVSTHALRATARQPPYPEDIRRFIVAPQDHLFGMARMYELSEASSRANLQVVRSRAQALAALGVQNPKFEPVSPP